MQIINDATESAMARAARKEILLPVVYLMTVQQAPGILHLMGAIPIIELPRHLIGKTVRVAIEKQL